MRWFCINSLGVIPVKFLTFVKNEYYWQEGKPYIDELVYKVVDDDNQALNQLLAGEIDGIEDLSLSNASNVDGNADTKTATSFSYNVEDLLHYS